MSVRILIYVTILISIVTYLFWESLPKGSFYIGNALSVFLMGYIIHKNSKSLGSFYLLCITAQNLLDELIFNPTILSASEIIFALILPIFWLIKYKRLCLINWYSKNFRS